MKIFISWSGERSRAFAEAFSSWIKQLVQATEPWISPEIEKGSRWSEDLVKRLDESRFGIVCLTNENLTSDWILFEAGALSKTKDARVCTFLLDLTPADVKPPLGQFQATIFEKEDVLKLVHDINAKIHQENQNGLTNVALEELFNTLWPKLEEKVNSIKAQSTKKEPIRPDREILEEILGILRSNDAKPRNWDVLKLKSPLFEDVPIHRYNKRWINQKIDQDEATYLRAMDAAMRALKNMQIENTDNPPGGDESNDGQ